MHSKDSAPVKWINVRTDMYEGAITRMRAIVGDTKDFPITMDFILSSATDPIIVYPSNQFKVKMGLFYMVGKDSHRQTLILFRIKA